MKKAAFKVGDSVFYPAAGVGVIERTEEIYVNGQREHFYVIRILESEVTIKIPQATVQNNGIRPLLNGRKLKDLFRLLSEESTPSAPAGNAIEYYKNLERRINNGSCLELGVIVRDLMRQKKNGSLSFDEARLLETARGFLTREIATVAGIPTGTAADRIREHVG